MLKYIGYLVGLGVIFISGVYMPYNAIERWSREMYYKQYETDRVNAMLRGFGGDERRFADCYLVEELGVKIGSDRKDYCLKHNRIRVLDDFPATDHMSVVVYRPLEPDCDFDEYFMCFADGRFALAFAKAFHNGQDAARRTFGDVKTAVERKYGCQMFDAKEVDASPPL